MLASKARRSVSAHGNRSSSGQGSKSQLPSVPNLDTLIECRDYAGAIATLEFKHQADPSEKKTLEWLGFCYFHNGDYNKALARYKQLQLLPDADPMYLVYRAACLYYLDCYKEAEEMSMKGPFCALQTRLLFHLAHRLNDEAKLVSYHGKITNAKEDQLSLASIHFAQMRYEEATEIYKALLLENRDWIALNVYIALCYYNLDHYDVSLEVLNGYLQNHPESALAINLKACNNFQLFNGKAAEAVLTTLDRWGKNGLEEGLLDHNLVVFRNGEGALQVLPPLLDVLPEARLNLVINHLRCGDSEQAYECIKNYEPTTPQEYVVKAVASASFGQETDSQELVNTARHYFHLVGASPNECDTILGRQCMASCYILQKQYKDALIYLQSIKSFCENQDEFNWNYAIAKAGVGEFKEAEEGLLLIRSKKYLEDYYYVASLVYCYIMNGKANLAWELFLRLEASDENFSMLQLIANACYKTEQYVYAAKAFHTIEGVDASANCWEGKRGACLGVFKKVVAGLEPEEQLGEVFVMLENSSHPQVELLVRALQDCVKETSVIPALVDY